MPLKYGCIGRRGDEEKREGRTMERWNDGTMKKAEGGRRKGRGRKDGTKERKNERTMERENDCTPHLPRLWRTKDVNAGKKRRAEGEGQGAKNEEFKVKRLNVLSTKGVGSNSLPKTGTSQGGAKRNPGYMYIQRNRRNYCFLIVTVSFHPAHPGI